MDPPTADARALRTAQDAIESDGPARILGHGQMSLAVLVGEDVVVRFPRHAVGIAHLERERRVVRVLKPHLPDVMLPVPGPADLHPRDTDRRPFASHRLVPGSVLLPASLAVMADDTVSVIATSVARLLDALAMATPPARAGVLERSMAQLADAMTVDVEALLAPRLSRGARSRIRRMLEAFAAISTDACAVCHTDLGGNLIWDADQGRLGMIDLGTVVVGDPVLDLASVSVLGQVFTASVADATQHLAGRLEDAASVRATFALQEAILAARQGQWSHVNAVLATI